ncbi:hypothetical protein Enr13x_19920 [Stieleria neptunia]|uniref:Uncharacterized protein n=1 Tax=Stieleria neptunia TaxID=2527979 RepID=A0A518HMV6_9BACT|nr:hypothetical protein [Stieleria neptunia]QDV42149.1 hypothetical protein Enr13x_19920 [Stieleria neptunia]
MTDSANRSTRALRIQRRNALQTMCRSGVSTLAKLACAASMMTATHLAAGDAGVDVPGVDGAVPITSDPTATLVRLAPRILISNPAGQPRDAVFSGRAQALRCCGNDEEPEGSRPAANTSRNTWGKCFTALPAGSDASPRDAATNQSQRPSVQPLTVSQVTFSPLHQTGQTPGRSDPSTQQPLESLPFESLPFESLPQPPAGNTVEVEVEVPALVQPVPLSQPPGLLPMRRESAAEAGEQRDGQRNDTFDSFDAPQPELIESDVLELGDRQFGGDVIRREPVAGPTPSTGAWLDIRPRGLGASSQQLVADGDLPGDTSGLARHDPVPHLTMLHRSDLTMRDFWAGASFCHQPLYFEDNRLERYGAIRGPLKRVPAVHSGIHFAWKAGVLPLSAAIDPPCSSVRSGYHTPPLKRLIR